MEVNVKNINASNGYIDAVEPFFGVVPATQNVVVIRKWREQERTVCYLAVNCHTLRSMVLKDVDIQQNYAAFSQTIAGTKYFQYQQEALLESNQSCGGIPGAGPGFVTTIDLCPSRKPMDRHFFDMLMQQQISPVYVCVSGLWIERHPSELAYLRSLEAPEIVWVNHSYSHDFKGGFAYPNFMLLQDTDVEHEVLHNEQVLLQNGLTPSVFFRFPGLHTDMELSKKIVAYGLLPLGANTWLARGEALRNGSIVLVHANGNEPEGLQLYEAAYAGTDLKPTSL